MRTSTWKKSLLWAAGAVVCFHLAYAGLGFELLVVGYLYCLLRLAEADSQLELFWVGLLAGLLLYAPPLYFFWTIFGPLAISLWLVLCFWLLSFLFLARACRRRFGLIGFALAAPFLWTGLEYFRSECYYLRFTWLTPGYAFSETALLPFVAGLGAYGLGFAAMAMAAGLTILPTHRRLAAALLVLPFVMAIIFFRLPRLHEPVLRVAGLQLEFPSLDRVIAGLGELAENFPETKLYVLSEYTFHTPVPEAVKAWCRDHGKFLLIGAIEPMAGGQFYDTAFVVGPTGDIVFSQAKCVPVQFFHDGLPAREQHVWDSPWGKIGIGICYDASYRRVVDVLVRQGATMLIFPTMDVISWGPEEHHLNSLVGPIRAAEYGLPLFRLASSGTSQIVNAQGAITQSAGCPGQGDVINGEMTPADGHLPLDYWLAPFATAVTGILLAYFVVLAAIKRQSRAKEKT